MKKWIRVCLAMLLGLTACSQRETKEKLSLEKTYVHDDITYQVKELEALKEPQYVNVEWVSPQKISFDEQCDLAVKGNVSNVREISLEYTFMESAVVDYGMVFDVEIEKVYIGEATGVVTIYLPWSSRECSTDIVMPKEGENYYFILTDATSGTQGLENFADYYISYAIAYVLPETATQKNIEYLEAVMKGAENYRADVFERVNAALTEGNVGSALETFFE